MQKKTLSTENLALRTINTNFCCFQKTKILPKISDMDWAQHIKIDYAQNLRKDTKIGKNRPQQNYTGCGQSISQFYDTRNLQ